MEYKYSCFSALIIDPESATRMRLKQATSSVAEFGKVTLSASLNEAMHRLSVGDPFDVCFISSELRTEEIDRFVRDSKAHKNGQDAAFISVMRGNSQESSTVAGSVIAGFDGLLFEPYSVDQLIELTRLAARVKSERSAQREVMAISLIVKEMVGQINQLAAVKRVGIDSTSIARKLKQTKQPLERLHAESMVNYYSMLTESFMNAEVPKEVFKTKSYAGSSSRIQKRQKDLLQKEAESLVSK